MHTSYRILFTIVFTVQEKYLITNVLLLDLVSGHQLVYNSNEIPNLFIQSASIHLWEPMLGWLDILQSGGKQLLFLTYNASEASSCRTEHCRMHQRTRAHKRIILISKSVRCFSGVSGVFHIAYCTARVSEWPFGDIDTGWA